MEAGSETCREAFVISRMELDDVQTPPLSIVGPQAWRMLIGEMAALERLPASEG
jgi:hypothetical protein